MKSQNLPNRNVRSVVPCCGKTESQKADILLVQPPIQDFYLTQKRTVPYGLISIASVLRSAGFRVRLFDALATSKSKVLDMPKEMDYLYNFYPQADASPLSLFYQYHHYGYSFDHLGKIVREANPFLVGISSLFTAYADSALKTAAVVKKYHPGCSVVLGGHHPTALPREVMAHPCVDYVIRGEGEIPLLKLAQSLAAGGDGAVISGLVWRSSNGSLKVTDPWVNPDLNRLPTPAHDLVKSTYYRRSKKAALTITASRGCPMNCSYCSVGAGSYLTYRRRSVGHVLEEIDSALRLGKIGFIDFEDENLSMDKAWFLALLEGIRQRWANENVELRAMNGLFPPSLDRQIIAAMKTAGFKTLNLSLGSTHAHQLKRFHRPDVRAAFDAALAWAHEQDLQAVAYVIVGAPYQDAAESVEDLLFLARRKVLAGVSVYYPAPGSKDYERCRRLNILPGSFRLMRSTCLPISHATSRTEAVTLMRLGRILNFIKYLIDRGLPLPPSEPAMAYLPKGLDRLESGKRLLAWFLQDGIIRGVTLEGRVYVQRCSSALMKQFHRGLLESELKGTC